MPKRTDNRGGNKPKRAGMSTRRTEGNFELSGKKYRRSVDMGVKKKRRRAPVRSPRPTRGASVPPVLARSVVAGAGEAAAGVDASVGGELQVAPKGTPQEIARWRVLLKRVEMHAIAAAPVATKVAAFMLASYAAAYFNPQMPLSSFDPLA